MTRVVQKLQCKTIVPCAEPIIIETLDDNVGVCIVDPTSATKKKTSSMHKGCAKSSKNKENINKRGA